MSGLVAFVAAVGMIGFSLLVIAGCLVYSFFDDLPFMRNPFFGDILGAGVAVVSCALILFLMEKEHWFFDVRTHFSKMMDGLTAIWLPALFGVWILIAWAWRKSHGIDGPGVLRRLVGTLSW